MQFCFQGHKLHMGSMGRHNKAPSSIIPCIKITRSHFQLSLNLIFCSNIQKKVYCHYELSKKNSRNNSLNVPINANMNGLSFAIAKIADAV